MRDFSHNASPIGIFDSGLGGLTVARAIMDMLPHESVFYVGDTANGPYGPLSLSQVRGHALAIMSELVEARVKLIVIACNTASAAVGNDLRTEFTARTGIPVVQVISPAVRRAMNVTHTGRIGVIGTSATIESGVYVRDFAARGVDDVVTAACPKFVEYVEAGVTTGADLIAIAREYLQPLLAAQVTTVVLGCTHYPMLKGVIGYVMGPQVTLVDSASETAIDVYRELVAGQIENRSSAAPHHEFAVTAPSPRFTELAQRFLGPVVANVGTLRL